MAVSTIALVMMKFHNSQVSNNQHIVKYSPLGHYFLHSICAYVDLESLGKKSTVQLFRGI